MRILLLSLAVAAAVVACSGSSASVAGTGAPCVHDPDCGPGNVCAYKAADGCGATGHCFASASQGGAECNAYQPACTCEGSTVSIACTPYPYGYAGAPIAHVGACEGLDGGPPDVVGDAGGGPCGTTSCNPGEMCVQTTTSGGACFAPSDGGACPPGTVMQGSCCVNMSTTSACQPIPAACGGSPSCACASTACGGCLCQGTTAGVLSCACLAP